MIRFNYLVEQGAVYKNKDGRYGIDFAKFDSAMASLTQLILTLQEMAIIQKTAQLVKDKAIIKTDLAKDLELLKQNQFRLILFLSNKKKG